jgi:hypothetical protein
MDGLEADKLLIEGLVAWAGQRPARIALAAGIANTTVNRPYRGTATTRISQSTLDKLRGAYPEFPGWSQTPDYNARPAPPMEGATDRRMRRDVPIYGTALGAPKIIDGEAIEQTMLNSGEVVDYAKRPVILDGRSDVYGLYVQGSSMSPRHYEGETVYVDPRRTPKIGDDVVVYLTEDGERDGCALIKRLVRTTANYVELEQFTPAKIFRIDRGRVSKVHRVIPWSELIS